MTRLSLRERCLAIVAQLEAQGHAPTTDQVIDALGIATESNYIGGYLRQWQRGGWLADGPKLARTRADKLGPKWICTWLMAPTLPAGAHAVRRTCSVEEQHVAVKPAAAKDAKLLVEEALAAQPLLQRCWSGWA